MNRGPVRDREGSGIALLWRKVPGMDVLRRWVYKLRMYKGLEPLVSMDISGRILGYYILCRKVVIGC